MKKLVGFFSRVMERYLPDAFLFAAILTFITFLAVWLGLGVTPKNVLLGWGNGFWNLLAFSCQMSLVTIFGYAMCKTPIFAKFIKWVAGLAKNPAQAMFYLGIVSVLSSFLNWGIGIILPAMLAREMCRTVKGVDYRMAIGVSFAGSIVAGMGLSSPVFLMVSLPNHLHTILPSIFSATDVYPISQTLFSGFNLITVLAWLIVLPILGAKLHPTPENTFVADPAVLVEPAVEALKKERKDMTIAEKMETSKILWALLCILGWAYIIWWFATKGFDVQVSILIFVLLFVGLSLSKDLITYVRIIQQVTGAAAGILLTFPFYAGIQAMMSVKNGANKSLAIVFSNMFVSISTIRTYPLWTLLSAGFLNMFIPSGGGQWTIQGPIMLGAGDALGANPIKTLTAVSYGDQITNLIQPFWMLPALSIAKLKARDIMGFLVVAFLAGLVIMALTLSLIGPF